MESPPAEAAPKKKARRKAQAAAPAAEPAAEAAPSTGAGAAPTPEAAAGPKEKQRKERPERPAGKPRRRRKISDEDELAPPVGFEDLSEGATPRKKKKKRGATKDRERVARMRKRKRRLQRRRERVRPSPPLQETDPLAAYLAGEMVPCPVGCGGFSEVVRVGTLESGAGEVWFECLSCAQRRMYQVPAATEEESAAVANAGEEGHEAFCARHARPVSLRRRGRQFVCPVCGVVYGHEEAA